MMCDMCDIVRHRVTQGLFSYGLTLLEGGFVLKWDAPCKGIEGHTSLEGGLLFWIRHVRHV